MIQTATRTGQPDTPTPKILTMEIPRSDPTREWTRPDGPVNTLIAESFSRDRPIRRVVTQRVGVEHDPVYTVIGSGQQVTVAFTEFIDHVRTVTATHQRNCRCPEGAIDVERSLKINVAVLCRRALDF